MRERRGIARPARARVAALLPLLPLAACIPGPRPDPPEFEQPAPPPVEPELPPRPNAGREVVVPPSVAKPPPAWAATPVVPDARTVAATRYTVRAGDTLRRIAEKTGSSSELIARENRLSPPFTIRTGQVLTVPGGRFHTVRSGQAGIAIARAYQVEWSRIVALNDLEEPYVLRTGQRLLLPSAGEVRDMSLEQRAAAFMLDIDDLITGSEPAIARGAKPAPPVRTAARPIAPDRPVAAPSSFAGRFDWPLDGPLLLKYGPYGSGRVNEGINIGVVEGTPIRAAADGVVAYAGSEIAVFGGLILIKHGDNWITTYGHADALLVTRGQQVKRGQVIARAGETGSVRSPQLHFEIRRGRRPVDPLLHLPARG